MGKSRQSIDGADEARGPGRAGGSAGHRATLDGIPGQFTIDTGSRSSLTLHRPFIEEHGLMARYKPNVEAVTGWGVGGSVRSHVSRAKNLSFGNVRVANSIVQLFTGDEGAFAARHTAGNIGGGILERFTLTIDYANQRLFFAKNRCFSAPDNYDRAGMWLNVEGGAFRVEDLVPGSPADRAGLAVGDRIIAINGKEAGEMSLSSVRQLLRDSAPGTRVIARVESAGQQKEVPIALRDLL